MGHRLFPLRSIQASPVPTKGVPELAGPVLKSLQTLGLAVVGSGRSQPQHGEFANPPASHCRVSQNPVDGRDVLSNLRSLLRCTIRSGIGCRRRRLRQLSPNRQEYVRPGYHHLPSPETPLSTMLPPGGKVPDPFGSSPQSAGAPIVTIRTIAVISIAVFPLDYSSESLRQGQCST